MDELIYQTKLKEVRAVFPGRLAVPASLGAEACGIAAKTLRNRLTAGDPPFPTFKVGDRRLVQLSELARFLASQKRWNGVLIEPFEASIAQTPLCVSA